MQVFTTFDHRGDESNAEASSPVSEQICKAGCLIVLVRLQLRIGNDIHRNEEQSISQPLQCALPRVVTAVRGQIHIAVHKHCKRYKRKTQEDKCLCRNNMSLQKLRRNWRQHSDDKSSWPKDKARIDSAIAIEGLQHLRNQGCRAK